MSAAVDVRDVFRVHRTREGDAAALQGLTLAVARGEVLTVLGPSGAGKSTLLDVLAGLQTPSAGTASVLGRELGTLGPRERARFRAAHLGLVDQHHDRALPPALACVEGVALGPALRGVPRTARRRRAEELLDRVGLADRAQARPGELSGGERQRVSVCAALAHRPELVLADEPGGELDAAAAATVYALLAELAGETGATVVLVSHDPAATRVADRTVRLRDGRIAEERRADGEESLVVGRGGWVRLPQPLLGRAGLVGARLRVTAEPGALRLDAAPAAAGAPGERSPDLVPPAPAAGMAPSTTGPPGDRPLDLAPTSTTDGPRTDPAPPPPVAPGDFAPPRPGGAPPSAAASRAASGGPSARPPGACVEVRGVTLARGDRRVLDAFDMTLAPGRLTALAGRSGSGKTTVLLLLAGLSRPDAGSVLVDGVELGGLDRSGLAAFRRQTLGFLAQGAGLVDHLSARENVALALTIRGVLPGEAAARAERALHEVGLAERVRQRVARLSAGERQRVALACALAPQPRLLLADEPTSRLDEASSAAMAVLLAEVCARTGATILIATHEPLVVDACDERFSLGGA